MIHNDIQRQRKKTLTSSMTSTVVDISFKILVHIERTRAAETLSPSRFIGGF